VLDATTPGSFTASTHGINKNPGKQDAAGFSVFQASALDEGRRLADRDVSPTIEDATGFTLDH
jgi:hypothetical protein